MNIEFVDFYPYAQQKDTKKTKVLGTCHIYFIDYEIDLRGILVISSKNGIFFKLPYLSVVDPENKVTLHKIRFPVFHFTNQKKHFELLEFLKKEVKPIIESRLLIESK